MYPWEEFNVEGIYQGNTVRIVGLAGRWGNYYVCERRGNIFTVHRDEMRFKPKTK